MLHPVTQALPCDGATGYRGFRPLARHLSLLPMAPGACKGFRSAHKFPSCDDCS
jgi:hypothetical protein